MLAYGNGLSLSLIFYFVDSPYNGAPIILSRSPVVCRKSFGLTSCSESCLIGPLCLTGARKLQIEYLLYVRSPLPSRFVGHGIS